MLTASNLAEYVRREPILDERSAIKFLIDFKQIRNPLRYILTEDDFTLDVLSQCAKISWQFSLGRKLLRKFPNLQFRFSLFQCRRLARSLNKLRDANNPSPDESHLRS